MYRARYYVVAMLLMLQATLLATEVTKQPQPTLFDNVVKELSQRFFNKPFRENELPKWVELYESRAAKADTFEKQLDVVQDFLTNIPSSHLGLISAKSVQLIMNELASKDAPTFGFELIEYDGKHYANSVLDKGPADFAGLRRGDRIISIDGLLVNDSPRLGWRNDEAFLPDQPVRDIHGDVGDTIKLRVESTPGVYREVEVPCQLYSKWKATQASARIVEHDGKRIGVIHFWMIQLIGPDKLLKEKLEGDFASCDALVLDLRGHGGSGFMVKLILDVLEGISSTWNKPTAAIINEHSRSAKEVIAYEFRQRKLGSLVGERTAGAAIPVTLADVGFGMKLMFPTFSLPKYTEILEFNGVKPDIFVAEVGPYSHGADPIFDAAVIEAVRLSDLPIWKNKPQMKTAITSQSKEKTAHAQGRRSAKAIVESATKIELAPSGYDATAIDVLDKMVHAMGGEALLLKHTARTVRGSLNIGEMIDGTYTTLQATPYLLKETVKLDGMGTFRSGYDGSVGWEVDPNEGAKFMSEEDQQDALVEGGIHAVLHYKKHHRAIRYVGLAKFDGKDCHELRLTRHNEKVETRYIDASSYLPIGAIGEVRTQMGPMKMIRTVKEYKAFDGEMIPVHYVEDIGGVQKVTKTVIEVSFDAIPENAFHLPKDLVAD